MRQLRLDLEHEPAAAPAARRGVLEFLRDAWPDYSGEPAGSELLADVAIVVSELVSNAVRHGRPPVCMEVEAGDDGNLHTVRVTCHDSGPWDGTPPHPDGGRGFVLLRGLATDVMIDADRQHTTVAALLVG